MIRYAFAQIVAHRVRFALTVLAVLLGVAFATGSLVLNDTAQRRFDDQFRTATAGVDLTVRTATAFDSGMGIEVERDPLAASVVDDVRAIDGVTAAVPVVKGLARLERDGVDLGRMALSSWVDAPLGAFDVRDGRAPQSDGEFVLDARTAERLGMRLGERAELVGNEGIALTLVGVAGFGSSDGLPSGSAVLTTIDTARHVLGLGDDVSEVLVTSELAPAELQPVIGRVLGDGVEVATAQDLAAAGAEAAAANLEMLQVVLIAMTVAALVVGGFLIANTFSIVVAQRTRELAVLRAAGASGSQVRRMILVEALVVGVFASLAGTLAGVFGAHGLRALATAFGVGIPAGDLVVEPRTLVIGAAVGIGVTTLAALAPARRAAAVSPLQALRTTAAEPRRISRARVVAAVSLAVIGVALAAAPAFGASVLVLAAGLVGLVLALVLGAPSLAAGCAAALAPVTDRLGIPARLARESVARSPRRAAGTFVALALGLAVMVFVSIIGASVKAGTAANYREVVAADVVIESAGQEMLGGVHAAVYDELASVDEVGEAVRLKYGHWRDADMMSALSAFEPAKISDVVRVRMIDGSIERLASGGVVIAERVAADRGVGVGDTLPMTFARTGEQRLPIVGVVADATAQALMTDYLVSLDTYADHFTEDMDASIFVLAADGVGSAELRAALERSLVDHPTVQVRDQAAVIAGRSAAVDQIFGLVSVLMMLALAIAVLGVANTLALSISERTRELGLLRAVGMARGQVAAMVQLEALLVTALAVVAGVGLGLLAGLAMVGALSQIAALAPVIPLPQLAGFVVIIAVAGAVAGIVPSSRASRVPVLEAIADA